MKKNTYFAYLLRVWQTTSNGETIWRASLESPGNGERRGFASLPDLFAFLQTLVNDAHQAGLVMRTGGGDEPSS